MQLETTYTKEQAIELLKCSKKAQKNWIIKKLQEIYTTVETVGRGKNIIFICKIEDDTLNTPAGAYKALKNILIEDYGFHHNFDYNSVLKLIGFHINNEFAMSNGTISAVVNIAESSIYNYRNKLKNGILKDTKQCKKLAIGRNAKTYIDEDITDFYHNRIIPAFASRINEIQTNYFNNINAELALFTNSSNGSFMYFLREEYNFDDIKKAMNKAGNKYIATYPVAYEKGNKVELNQHLRNKIFELTIREFGYLFKYDLYIYELHEDLKRDKQFLQFIKLAIQERDRLEIKEMFKSGFEKIA